jgi:hypothetical protein
LVTPRHPTPADMRLIDYFDCGADLYRERHSGRERKI